MIHITPWYRYLFNIEYLWKITWGSLNIVFWLYNISSFLLLFFVLTFGSAWSNSGPVFIRLLHILLIGNFANFEQKNCNEGQLVKIKTFRPPIDTGIPMLDSFANILAGKYRQFCFKQSTMTQNWNRRQLLQLQSMHWIINP